MAKKNAQTIAGELTITCRDCGKTTTIKLSPKQLKDYHGWLYKIDEGTLGDLLDTDMATRRLLADKLCPACQSKHDIFTPDNTEWDYDLDEGGAYADYLKYTGSMEELAEETGLTVSELEDLLHDYELASRDLIEEEEEIREARTGQY